MPVKAIKQTSIARNGIGAYVIPCHKINLQFCNWGGSSHGVRELLKTGRLNEVASQKPNIFFDVSKRQGHPKLLFYYNNKSVREVDVRNMETKGILQKIQEFSQSSGNAPFKYNHKVLSVNESVRGIWSPLHVPKGHRHNI